MYFILFRRGLRLQALLLDLNFLFYALILPFMLIPALLQNTAFQVLSSIFQPSSFTWKPSWSSQRASGQTMLPLIMFIPPQAKKPPFNYPNARFRHPSLIPKHPLHKEWFPSQILLFPNSSQQQDEAMEYLCSPGLWSRVQELVAAKMSPLFLLTEVFIILWIRWSGQQPGRSMRPESISIITRIQCPQRQRHSLMV